MDQLRLSRLNSEIETLSNDIRSEKVASRNKALAQLDKILVDQKDDIIELLNYDDLSATTTFSSLYDNCTESIIKQSAKLEEAGNSKSLQTLLNKNPMFSGIVDKIVEICKEAKKELKANILIDCALTILSNRSAVKHFGAVYLRTIESGIFNSRTNMFQLSLENYSDLLQHCFKIYEKNSDISKVAIIRVINASILSAYSCCPIVKELRKHTKKIKLMIENISENDYHLKSEVIKLVNLFISNVITDFHQMVRDFLKETLTTLCSFYDYRMKNDIKDLLFEICQICLQSEEDFLKPNDGEKKYWQKIFRNMIHVVEVEIRESNSYIRSENETKLSEEFLSFASILCYAIYWDIEINDDNNTQQVKRIKKLSNIPAVLDLVKEKNKINFKWLQVLSRLLNDRRHLIEASDIECLLEVLFCAINETSKPDQLQCVHQCCGAILHQEVEMGGIDSKLGKKSTELWISIFELTASERFQSASLHKAKHELLQLLLQYNKISSDDFVIILLKSIISHQGQNTNSSLKTIACIYKYHKILLNDDFVTDIIRWMFSSTNKLDTRFVYTNKSALDPTLVAEIICLLIFNGELRSNQDEHKSVNNNKRTIIKMNLEYKYMKRLIFVENRRTNFEMKEPKKNYDVVNRTYFQYLVDILQLCEDDTAIITCDTIAQLVDALAKLETVLFIFNGLIKFDHFDDVLKQPIIKKIGILIQRINYQMGNINLSDIEAKSLEEIFVKLEAIFNRKYSNELLQYIREEDMEKIYDFIGSATKNLLAQERSIDNDTYEFRQKLGFQGLKYLAFFADKENCFNCIQTYNFDLDNPKEMIVLFDIMEILCSRTFNQTAAEFVIDCLKTLCAHYHTNHDVSLNIIIILPKIVSYIKNCIELMENVCIALISFLKKCYREKYSIQFTQQILSTIKDVAKIYPNSYECDNFKLLYISVANFIASPSLLIQYAAIECIGCLIDEQYVLNTESIPSMLSEFSVEFFIKVIATLNQLESSNLEDKDYRNNLISVTLQCLFSGFGINFSLRKICFPKIAFIIYKYNIESSTIINCLENISRFSECDIISLTRNLIEPLFVFWLRENHPLERIPWYLISKNEGNHLIEHLDILSFCILRIIPSMLGTLETSIINIDKKTILTKAFPLCYSFCLPYVSKENFSDENYNKEIANLLPIIKPLISDFTAKNSDHEKVWKVLYNFATYLWDEEDFRNYFKYSFNYLRNDRYLNLKKYKKILRQYMISQYGAESNESVFDGLLKMEPLQLINFYTAIKHDIQKSLFIEDKLIFFYRYCSTVKLMLESMNSQEFALGNLNGTRAYFIRDIIYFLRNTIENTDYNYPLLKAALEFLYNFCYEIIDSHCVILEANLQIIVSTLISLVLKDPAFSIKGIALKILNFFVVTSGEKLKNSLILFDDFPDSEDFSSIRKRHNEIKYEGAVTTLAEDVKFFLQIPNRGIEGVKTLYEKISAKKDELINIYLQPLYAVLLKTIKKGDNELAIEATKCLGELGPLKIESMSLCPHIDDSAYEIFTSHNDNFIYLIKIIVKQLESLIVYSNCDIASAASEASKTIFKTSTNKKLIKEHHIFTPFTKADNTSHELKNIVISNKIDLVEILKGFDCLSYASWICKFTSKLYELYGNNSLQKLAELEQSFCEATLTTLVRQIFLNNNETGVEKLINYFFESSFKSIVEINKEEFQCDKSIYLNKSVMKCFLSIAECIRICDQKVKIDYMKVAKISAHCEAYFLAIIYLELWALEEQKDSSVLIADLNFQNIAILAYKSIGCNDAISGFLDPLKSRTEYLEIQNQWQTLLLQLDATSAVNSSQYLKYLKSNGFYAMATKALPDNQIDYESLWRLGQWDALVDKTGFDDYKFANVQSTPINLENEFQKEHFKALKAIKNMEKLKVISAVTSARKSIVAILKVISTESTENVYKYLTWLQLLEQIDDFSKIQFEYSTQTENILNKWKKQDILQYGNFEQTELLLSQKLTLFGSAGQRATRTIRNFYPEEDFLSHLLLRLVKECRINNKNYLAIRYLALLENRDLTTTIKVEMHLENAELNWSMGNIETSKSLLHHILQNKEFNFSLRKIDAFRLYGEFLSESNSDNFENINEFYFNAADKLLKRFNESKIEILDKVPNHPVKNLDKCSIDFRRKNFASIAKYADREYLRIHSYVNSDDFKQKNSLMRKNNETVSRSQNLKTDGIKLAVNMLRKNSHIDDREIKITEFKYTKLLCLAVENYIEYILLDEEIKSPAMFRIISLWFANKDNVNLLGKIKQQINNIPIYKFIPVLNQITARLNSINVEFNILLEDILVKCAIDHPYHTLPYIFALINANMDSQLSQPDSRSMVGSRIAERLKEDEKCKECVAQIEQLCQALITFANEKIPQSSSVTLSQKLKKIKNLDCVQCPTLELEISKNKTYNIIFVQKWLDKVDLVGGINVPKKITCLCSDGLKRPQLLKGRDDLRQDALMQQILSIINDMLKIDKESCARRLNLRTYKVVPLSKRSGIMEWCLNAIPIGEYLAGSDRKSGAHAKYKLNDFTIPHARSAMMKVKEGTPNDRCQVLRHIYKKIKPVFHHFFFENFPRPGVWFERTLSYTKSVAVSSIVGYILGIGDRHVSNILIDKSTAEVIHIDFGIAFEQGKIMPTPETVPFRLTRDMIAPMGVCATEGIFRKSCECTFEVLQKNQTAIMTILEVLLYDPLYNWILNPEKIKKSQDHIIDEDDVQEQKNTIAERALFRVRSKLKGIDEADLAVSTTQSLIERLIKDATDIRNLCLIYPGWDPYL